VPTIRGGAFAVADAGALQAALDALRPGAGAPGELWVRARAGTPPGDLARTLTAGGGVTVRTRAGVLAALRADPLRRSLDGVLAAAAVVALALALVGVALGVGRLVRDGAAELADLEADGTPPSALRRLVAVQGAAIAVLALAGGAALAAVLTALAPAVVRAATGGAQPVPPLHAALPAGGIASLAAGATAVAVLLVAVLARRLFRDPWPAGPATGRSA
jgi:predicted lysophospholipase L1 biosynthesis ABC-type transport system permease subunit